MCSFAASALVGLLKKCRTWDFDISDMIPDEKLLDEYEQEIELLENKADKTDRENKYLQELLLKERKLIQLIPEDEDVVVASNKGDLLVSNQQSKAGLAYRNIVKTILGEDNNDENSFEKKTLLGTIKAMFVKG